MSQFGPYVNYPRGSATGPIKDVSSGRTADLESSFTDVGRTRFLHSDALGSEWFERNGEFGQDD